MRGLVSRSICVAADDTPLLLNGDGHFPGVNHSELAGTNASLVQFRTKGEGRFAGTSATFERQNDDSNH